MLASIDVSLIKQKAGKVESALMHNVRMPVTINSNGIEATLPSMDTAILRMSIQSSRSLF